MSDYRGSILGELAHQQIDERVAEARSRHLPRRLRRTGRHTWATRLHHLADRLDD
jgi:hypothetical protein